jgi:putative transposase
MDGTDGSPGQSAPERRNQEHLTTRDNAAAESFFAALKNEMYYRHTFTTRARARLAVAEYIEVFYNRRRLHSTLGYRTPFEALTNHQTAAAA